MKYIILVLIVSAQMSCATQNPSSNEGNSMRSLIQKSLPVYFENQTFDESIDFTTFLEPSQISQGVSQVTINSGITFKKCVFKKSVNAFSKNENGHIVLTTFKGNVTFIDCIFKEPVNFRGSSIYGRSDFTGSTFDSEANFEEINCHQKAFFNACVFDAGLRFQNSFFNQKANFMGAEFYGAVSFQSSMFNSEFQCSATKFYKYADLTLIDCRGRALFNYAEFREKADFGHSIFAQDLDFISTKNTTTSFDNCRFFGSTRFNKIEVATALSFKSAFFLFNKAEIDIPSEKLLYSDKS